MQLGQESGPLINWRAFSQARTELGANFARILSYFREDGVKSVEQIEAAMRAHNSAALVLPAHTLKGESRQFGADPLADLAEQIEVTARTCVERQDTPESALAYVAQLRPLFEETLRLIDRETNPLVERRPQFGRRPAA
ncbi:Hpt domain-containing protein [Sphingomonas sp.]|uniref:Hpt domain-containing protein n=1 Tax=Sphingomonas sp. TaxID=28214 RepID=UPI001B2298FD|nr:Hpt domain-containing protein [Sphingomonas sp.]MBO9711305.1 Hpt domain-containing protein [Sphingomonas sp.]